MQQVTRYIVNELGVDQSNILSTKDKLLVDTFTLSSLPFYPTKNRVDIDFYDLNEEFIETVRNVKSYKVHGILQKDKANQIDVYPSEDAKSYGYNGDVILEYSFWNNFFSEDSSVDVNLYVTEISTDRTELRARCLDLSDSDVKTVVDAIYTKLNLRQYFSEIYLEFVDENVTATGINIMTEVVDGVLYVTFKTYEPLPDSVAEKSRFNVLERVGDSVKFQVIREVEVVPDPVVYLKKPNFNINTEEKVTNTTEYLNYNQLFSYPVSSSYYELYNLTGKESISIAVDYTDFSSFIHFSSAEERLENFRYKMELIESYEDAIALLPEGSADIQKYQNLLNGVVSNFDHYERYLYFESGSKAWPKQTSVRPYVNVPVSELDSEWWDNIAEEAEAYDETNQDILIGAIPFVIREDSRNEPFVVFVHMIGQHFDNEWIYAKALADKYQADNRLNFGISKDLVKEAIADLGLKLYESNQNLNKVFELCNPDGTYDTGSEVSVQEFKRISEEMFSGSTEYQPMLQDTYRKEVYKRIYHNLPILLKAKGTERGLRALVNCFGIPDDILKIEVRGGVRTDSDEGYFGPMDTVTSSYQKVRLDCTGSLAPFLEVSGSEIAYPVLHKDVSVVRKTKLYSDDSHQVAFGFDLNGQVNQYFRSELTGSGFDYDDIIGDPRNHGENYKDAFTKLRNQLLYSYEGSFRSPSAIIRLVRYFDSILFRSVKEFLPARSNVSVGAIVEDNILHRNRYRGATPTGSGHVGYVVEKSGSFVKQDQYLPQNVLISGTLDIVSVTGSDGGHLFENILPTNIVPTTSFEDYGRTIERSGSVPVYEASWSTGQFTGSKPIFDDSPAYNGEFGGSEITASDAEVLDNPYKRGGSSTMMYKVAALALDKPSPLVCDIVLSFKNDAYIHEYWRKTGSFDYMHYQTEFEFKVPKTGSEILAKSESVSLSDYEAISRDAQNWFMGWTSGSTKAGSSYFGYGSFVGPVNGTSSFVRSEHVEFNSDKCHTVLYSPATLKRERVRVQVEDLGSGSAYGYYGNSGLVVSFVYQSRRGATGSATVAAHVVEAFDVKVEYADSSSTILHVSGSTTESSSFQSCWGINVFLGENRERKPIARYGVVLVSASVTSNENNNLKFYTHSDAYPTAESTDPVFLDADWFYSYGDNDTYSWNKDNESAPYGWRIEWDGSKNQFNWYWRN